MFTAAADPAASSLSTTTRILASSPQQRRTRVNSTNAASTSSSSSFFQAGRVEQIFSRHQQTNNRRNSRMNIFMTRSEAGEGGDKSPAGSSTPYDYEGALLFLGL